MKKALILVGLAALLGVGFAAVMAQRKPATYIPNENQVLRLKVKQDAAVIAQKDMQVVQQRFQDALNALNAEADKVKAENRWPKDVKFSPDTLTFDMPKLTPLPSPAPAPTQKQ
jgi:hypothetical protein